MDFGFYTNDDLRDFVQRSQGNKNLKARLRYIYFDNEQFYAFALNKRKIVSAIILQNHKDELWVCGVTTDPQYQNQGLAKHLLKMVFEKAIEENKTLVLSSFTEEGSRYLKPFLLQMRNRFLQLDIRFPRD